MTRAPRSASWRVQNGAAMACSRLTTAMPSRGRTLFVCMFISGSCCCRLKNCLWRRVHPGRRRWAKRCAGSPTPLAGITPLPRSGPFPLQPSGQAAQVIGFTQAPDAADQYTRLVVAARAGEGHQAAELVLQLGAAQGVARIALGLVHGAAQ